MFELLNFFPIKAIEKKLISKMNKFRLYFFICLKIIVLVKGQILVTGDDDGEIRILALDGSVNKSICTGEKINSLEVIFEKQIVIAGRETKDILVWFFNNDSFFDLNNMFGSI